MIAVRHMAREAGLAEAWPRDAAGRQKLPVRALLEWAFAAECASLDHDEIGAVAGAGYPSAGNEYRIQCQLELGRRQGEGVRVDTSFGRSLPHHDAELVATVLRNAVSWFGQAVWVAELARARRAPDWDLGQPRLEPRTWQARGCRAGRMGKQEVLEVVSYRSRRRGKVKRSVMWVPCRWVPDPGQVAAARREYLAWWSILLGVREGLRAVELERFAVTDRMPPRTPWKEKA